MKHLNKLVVASVAMSAHHAAFLSKAIAVDFVYGKKDGEPTLVQIKESQDNILSTFEAFKEKNDERLKQIEKKGDADPVTVEQVEKINAELAGMKQIREDLATLSKKTARPNPSGEKSETFTPEQLAHKEAFSAFVRDPSDSNIQGELKAASVKAVSTTTDTGGGYAVPEIISRRIERELPEISPLRKLVDVEQVGTKEFKILVDVGGASYGWVGETDTRSETETNKLEEVSPTFGTLYAYPKASEESLDDIFFNVENWLINSALESFAVGEENAIVNGNGVKKPTGFLNGTPTAQKDGTRSFGVLQFFASGAAAGFASSNPVDPILSMIYGLKKGYRKNAKFLMNRATAGECRKFKDGDGNYLWQPSSVLGQPDKLSGYAIAESEEMPDVAANATPIAFGDFKAGYKLVDLVGLRLTRDEVTTPGYVKYYIRRRTGGNVKKSEAIKLFKIAA